jgi:nitroreductase
MNHQAKAALDFIRGRRSIRVFAPGDVPDATVQILLEAAMAAPSAVAKDPWRFIVIRRKETLARIAEELPNGAMLPSASLGMVVAGDLEAAHDRQISYLLQDCSAAIENLLLAAHILGLGACWLGIHPRENRMRHVSQVLELPKPITPVAAIAIGFPGETKEPRTRYDASRVHFEKW